MSAKNAVVFLVAYPFASRLYPGALDVLARFRAWAPTVILSDGDAVFQPRKVKVSGLGDAVDDKLRILTTIKQAWGPRVTTVFPRQGHYAHDLTALSTYRPADVSVERIADLLDWDLPGLLAPAAPAS